jgi:cell division protein FtsL
MGCAFSLVYSQQRTRQLFIEKNRLEIQQRKLNLEWNRLEYEQRELSRSSRIMDIAKNQLRMNDAKQDKTIYLKEKQ